MSSTITLKEMQNFSLDFSEVEFAVECEQYLKLHMRSGKTIVVPHNLYVAGVPEGLFHRTSDTLKSLSEILNILLWREEVELRKFEDLHTTQAELTEVGQFGRSQVGLAIKNAATGEITLIRKIAGQPKLDELSTRLLNSGKSYLPVPESTARILLDEMEKCLPRDHRPYKA